MCENPYISLIPIFTVPSAPPTHIYIHEVTSFNITIHWDPVDCIEQNGNITGYSVQYGVEGTGIMHIVNVSGGATTEITISGLYCAMDYTIEVAAVNSAGTGMYSNALYFITKGIIII